MKPTIERIDNAISPVWHFIDYCCAETMANAYCSWHYHNEIELVIYHDPHRVTPGKTVIGDYIGDAEHGNAYLVGPGLPHMVSYSSSATPNSPSSSHVLWLDQCWLRLITTTVPELSTINDLLVRASKGLTFSPQTAQALYVLMNETSRLKPATQFLRVIEILLLLIEDKTAKTLTSHPYCFYFAKNTSIIDKLEKAQRFIADHFNDQISVQDMCRHLHMSASSVYRMFEKHFTESFSDHLKRYRLGKACELLVRSNTPISMVAEKVGFPNLSNFNRQFKTMKHMTPTEFRKLFA